MYIYILYTTPVFFSLLLLLQFICFFFGFTTKFWFNFVNKIKNKLKVVSKLHTIYFTTNYIYIYILRDEAVERKQASSKQTTKIFLINYNNFFFCMFTNMFGRLIERLRRAQSSLFLYVYIYFFCLSNIYTSLSIYLYKYIVVIIKY